MKALHTLWTWTFLPLTALVVAMEIYASLDTTDATTPWTLYVVRYIPPWITFAAVGILIAWLPAHFIHEYRKARGLHPYDGAPPGGKP